MEQQRITEMVREVPGPVPLIARAFNRQERRKIEAQAKRDRKARKRQKDSRRRNR